MTEPRFPVTPPRLWEAATNDERTDALGEARTAPRNAPAPEPLAKGSSVGRYLILGKLGEGGMGVVYEAFDPELGRKVALKLLTPQMGPTGAGSLGRARLLREAQSMALLSHPNVVAVHDVLVDKDRVVMVMELVEGMTLQQWLQSQPRAWRDVVSQLSAAGLGLAAAHEKGVIHRDFKPENVLIGKEGRARVADFGIARSNDELWTGPPAGDLPKAAPPEEPAGGPAPTPGGARSETVALTEAGVIVGTPAYMAPEMVARGAVNARTDQFSFGVVLYEALYGVRPFGAATRAGRALLMAKGPPAPPANAPRLPSHLTRVLQRSLAPGPDDRYPSMRELLEELSRDPSVQRRRWLTAMTIAVASVLLVGGAGVLRFRRTLQCRAAGARLSGAWDGAARTAVAKAFSASHLTNAEEVSQNVLRALDQFSAEWTAMQTESCLATQVRGVQSARLQALRSGCLDDRLDELRATTRLLQGDPQLLRQGPQAVAHLTPVASCADEANLRAAVKPPSAAQQGEVSAIKTELARAQVLRVSRQCAPALEIARPLLTRARKLGYLPLEASVLNLIAHCEYRQKHPKEGFAANTEALNAATLAGDEREMGKAAINFVIHFFSDREVAFQWIDFAHALASRTQDPELDFLSNLAESTARAVILADAPGALQSSERALDVTRRHPGVIDPMLAVVTKISVANYQAAVGQYAEAETRVRDGLAEQLALLGPHDPQLAYASMTLGIILKAQGHPTEAEEALRESLRYASFGEEPRGTDAEEALADLAFARFDDAEAQTHAQRAVELLKRQKRTDGPEFFVASAQVLRALAESGQPTQAREGLEALKVKAELHKDAPGEGLPYLEVALGEALTLEGRAAEAVPPLQDAVRRLDQAQMPGPLAEARAELGRALLATGKSREAEPLFRQAIAELERAGGGKHPDLVLPLTGLGQALLEAGRAQEARSWLERAVALWSVHPGVHPGRALAKLDLARTLPADAAGSARAHALLEEALADEQRTLRVTPLDRELIARLKLAVRADGAGYPKGPADPSSKAARKSP